MKIIGIHDGHNSAAALIVDGEIKMAMQEERLRNEKNYFGFPELALNKILDEYKLVIDDIDYFTFNGNHVAYPINQNELLSKYNKTNSFQYLVKQKLKLTPIYEVYKKRRRANRILNLTSRRVSYQKIKFIEHHLCHASAAYFCCPWMNKDEKLLILTQDGSGDGLSATINIGYQNKIERIASIDYEDSLGRIYSTTTFMLGMVPLEHEYKLMGLAPYSPLSGTNKSYKIFQNMLMFKNSDSLLWKRNPILPPMQQIYKYLRKSTELHRFDWIDAGLQKYTEEMLVEWVRRAIQKFGIHKIALSGGTFMNVKANQKISELEEVNKIFIVPSCGDETNSFGSALNYYYSLNPEKSSSGIKNMYLGPNNTSNKECLAEIEKTKFLYKYFDDIELKVAALLANGEIVARCKGRMEFGARALGNRSILAEASDLNKIMVINNMIKKRDFWMPFAPVILEERASDYIHNPKNIEAPFMILTFNSTERYKEFIGGVQQIDLTARPQIINEEYNPEYYKILKEYEKITGKGVLINTSFNLHGLPIVYGPKEALFVFENSELEYLALGNYLLSKK